LAAAGVVLVVPLVLLSILVRLFSPWHDEHKVA